MAPGDPDEALKALAPLFLPLSEEERSERERVYTEAGQLDPAKLMQLLQVEIETGWL